MSMVNISDYVLAPMLSVLNEEIELIQILPFTYH